MRGVEGKEEREEEERGGGKGIGKMGMMLKNKAKQGEWQRGGRGRENNGL